MRILITAAGGGGTNGLVQTLGDHPYEFVGTNAAFYKAAASCIDPTYQIARATDEAQYLADINQLIDRHAIQLVVPNSDIEVEILAKHRTQVGAALFLPDHEVCRIANDKFLLYEHCQAQGIYMAKALNAQSLNELQEQLADFAAPKYWCRVRGGSGSRHTAALETVEEVLAFIAEKLEKHPALQVSDFIVSDYLPGDDCLVHTIWHEGKLQYLAMAHRQQYFGEQGRSAPTVIRKEYRPELATLAQEIAQSFAVPPHGLYNFDVKYDAEGKPALTEINIGRFYYNMPLFNSSDDGPSFHVYVAAACGKTRSEALISKDERIFLRDQDNAPVVLTPDALIEKVNILA